VELPVQPASNPIVTIGMRRFIVMLLAAPAAVRKAQDAGKMPVISWITSTVARMFRRHFHAPVVHNPDLLLQKEASVVGTRWGH
jgi:hypothetical protein